MHKADTPCRELWRDGAEETAPQTLHVCFREQAFPSQCNAHWQLVPAPEKPSTGPKKRQTKSIRLPDAAQLDVRRGHGTTGEPTKLYLGRTLYPALACVCVRAHVCVGVYQCVCGSKRDDCRC